MTMSSAQVDEAVKRASRLVNLFERKMISEASLVSELADAVTPETLPGVLASLTPNARKLVCRWARSLPDEAESENVLWPINREVMLSFKEWLREQESHENGIDKS
jgi:hypothetical protein